MSDQIQAEQGTGEELARRKLPEVLMCLTELLRYASEKNYMDDDSAIGRALAGIKNVNDVLARLNGEW